MPLGKKKRQPFDKLRANGDMLVSMNAFRLLPTILIPLLTACVGSIGNGVLPPGSDLPVGTSIAISAPTPQIENAMRSALGDLGYRLETKADYSADAGFSERPLNVSFESEGSLNSGNGKMPMLGTCKQRIQRLSLVIADARSGRAVYQGQAEITECAGLSDENALRLARGAVARMRASVVPN
jgi:hypothetical protein